MPDKDVAVTRYKISEFGALVLIGNGTVGSNAALLEAAIDHFPITVGISCLDLCGDPMDVSAERDEGKVSGR